MTREDFKIVPKFYITSSLTMILYRDTIIESVEIYKNYQTIEEESADNKKPAKLKTSKQKRTESEINTECERLIKRYIDKCTLISNS